MSSQYGHIMAQVGSTKYPFVIDPLSYQEVDITDFAPRAVGANVALGELGLYTDAGQEDFKHGYGEAEFVEQQSYAYSGRHIDARHGHIQLGNDLVDITNIPVGHPIKKVLVHRGETIVVFEDRMSMIVGDSQLIYANHTDIMAGDDINDAMSTSNYIILTNEGRLRVADCFVCSSSTNNSATLTGANWFTNVWQGGTLYIIGGTGAGQSLSITGNTSTTINCTGTFSPSPDSNSVFVVINDTGNASNQPTNFGKMAIFGGYYWAIENDTNYIHFWAEERGSDAEGNGTADIAAIQVGPHGTPLVDMLGYDNQLYVFREDGVWSVHQDNLAYQTGIMFQAEQSSLNFRDPIVWQGFLIFPVRNQLYKFRSGLQDITPPAFDDEVPLGYFGNYRGTLTRGKFMYVMGEANKGVPYVTGVEATARFVSILASSGVGWHKICTLDDNSYDDFNMWLDPLDDKIWVYGYKSSNATLQYIRFDSLSDLPYAYGYPTGATYEYLYTSWYEFNMPRIPKSFASVTIDGYYKATGDVTVDYRLDKGDGWTNIGTTNTTMEELSFPAGTEGQKIQLRIGLNSGASNYNTPVVEKIIIKLMLRPDVLYGVTCDVIVSDNLQDPNHLVGRMTASEIRAGLKACRASVSPIAFTDIYGTTANAYLSSVRFVTVAYEDVDYVQSIARCTFVFV